MEKVRKDDWNEGCPVILSYRIEWLIEDMKSKSGIERIKAQIKYREKAQMYNDIVMFKAYDIDYTGEEKTMPSSQQVFMPKPMPKR